MIIIRLSDAYVMLPHRRDIGTSCNLELNPVFFLAILISRKPTNYWIFIANIFTFRDVKFHERIFPFRHFRQQSDVPLPLVTSFIPYVPSFQQTMLQPDSTTHLTSTNKDSLSSPYLQDISTDKDSSSVVPSVSASSPPPRRTTRQSHQPRYLQDYFCGLGHSASLPSEHHAFVSLLEHYEEPDSYEQAA